MLAHLVITRARDLSALFLEHVIYFVLLDGLPLLCTNRFANLSDVYWRILVIDEKHISMLESDLI